MIIKKTIPLTYYVCWGSQGTMNISAQCQWVWGVLRQTLRKDLGNSVFPPLAPRSVFFLFNCKITRFCVLTYNLQSQIHKPKHDQSSLTRIHTVWRLVHTAWTAPDRKHFGPHWGWTFLVQVEAQVTPLWQEASPHPLTEGGNTDTS